MNKNMRKTSTLRYELPFYDEPSSASDWFNIMIDQSSTSDLVSIDDADLILPPSTLADAQASLF